jgi:putative peptidoglycan lipid II flippase
MVMRRLAGRGSNLVAAGIFLSRIAGLVREQVIGVVLGVSAATDAFRFAMRIPNFLQNLLGEGALSASFIPVYARLVEEGEEGEADELAGAVVSMLAALTVVLVALVVLLAEPMVWLFTGWEAELYDLAVSLTRITSAGLGFLVISAWCLGVLNSHRQFFLPYVAPVVWNGVQIAVLGAAIIVDWDADTAAIAAAWAVVAGGLGQLLIQIPKVRRLSPGLRASLRRSANVRDVLRRFGPAVGGRGVVQISSLADTFLAGYLVVGALSSFTFALPLYLLPISLFGFSVAAAELAEMSRRSSELEAVSVRVVPALRRVIVPGTFVTVAYLAAGHLMVDAIYGWPSRLLNRDFGDDAVTTVWLVLAAFSLGLPASMTARITQNTLYSLGDVRGPARIALIRLIVVVAAGAVLMLQLDWLTVTDGSGITAFGGADVPHWPIWERVPEIRRVDSDPALPPQLGSVGLALGASVAAWVEWALLRHRLRHRLGRPVRSGWGWLVTLAAIAAGGVMLAVSGLGLPSPIDAAMAVLLGAGTYVGVLWMQGVRSLSQLASKS